MKNNSNAYGFELIKQDYIKEIKSNALYFTHQKSGARLIALDNDDDNKVFSISFRTPVTDSSGLPHILEHSVLCGSKKFPLKEPFVELAKGSLHTFLNAMTFPDKTMYPVASKNEQDLLHLMDVYLDAVFFPRIYENPHIFAQEGWHFELTSAKSPLIYNGVVFNEMKGAYSSPERLLSQKVMQSLFPDSSYFHDSGGQPDAIVKLKYGDFIQFHQKYYHPSNCYLILYGNGNLEKQLALINDHYLNHFTAKKIQSGIINQPAFAKLVEKEFTYPLAGNINSSQQTYLSINYVVSTVTEPKTALGFDILDDILLDSQAAPLKKALLDANIGKDIYGGYETDLLQPFFSIIAKNSDLSKKELFQKTVRQTLEQLVKQGINQERVQACINKKEFYLKEADFHSYPKGLIYSMSIMESWLYDADPLLHLKYEEPLNEIKKQAGQGYFESIIEQYLLNNPHQSVVVLTPEAGLAAKKAEETARQLKKIKESMTAEEVELSIRETRELKEKQKMPDPPEKLAVIPLLDLKDISQKAEKIPQIKEDNGQYSLLYHPIESNDIIYLTLYFDTTVVPQPLLPYVPILTQVLSHIDTENYSYIDLSNQINLVCGGLYFNSVNYHNNQDTRLFYPKVTLSSKVLTAHFPRMLQLGREIISHSLLNDKKRLKEIIQQVRSRYEMRIMSSGDSFAISRISSQLNGFGYYDELTGGILFYQFISQLEKNFDLQADQLIENLRQVYQLIFNRNNLTICCTADQKLEKKIKQQLNFFLEQLPARSQPNHQYEFDLAGKKQAFIIPGQVQYVAKGFNFRKMNYNYSGHLLVLKTILQYNYLWNNIRVLGGAYGARINFLRNGDCYLSSYRDPNLKNTLDQYDLMSQYVRELNLSKRELQKNIIGTISSLDHPLTPVMKGSRATGLYFSHISQEEIQQTRDQVLTTGLDDLRKCADLISAGLAQNKICVVGSEPKINEEKEQFDETRKLIS